MMKIGWVGLGRMGAPMVDKVIAAGYPVKLWNRTRSKAEPFAGKGIEVVDRLAELREVDVLFSMVAKGKDLVEVYFGETGVVGDGPVNLPKIFVDCSSIGAQESAEIREKLAARNVAFLAAPVSGNGKCVKAGKLSAAVSGPREAYDAVRPVLLSFAPHGVSYVGDGEHARFCKIAHNVLLGVYIQTLAEITVLAQKAGVPRHAFLEFINNSVLGSTFSRYKTPALVNLDWTTTFTPELLRKDLDLGLEVGRALDVPMPVTAATREALQAHFGAARLKPDPAAYIAGDFAALLETVALGAGITALESENVAVPSGLEIDGH
jgi:3-hydroxyisobutyrate dehydrogenase